MALRSPRASDWRVTLIALTLLVGTFVVPQLRGGSPTAEAAASGFHGLTPARLWDTRSGPGFSTIDGDYLGTGRLGPQESFIVMVRGRGGVPDTANVRAVAVNITAIAPSAASFLTAYPATYPRPTASNLNTAPGRTLPNMAIVTLSDVGRLEIYNAAGSTDVALDVLGWFDRSGAYTGLNPQRLMDTRSGSGNTTVDGAAQGGGRLGADTSVTLDVLGRGDVPASGVGAVALNVTAIDPTAPSFITAYPAGTARPTASNLNLAPGRTVPNMVIVPVPASGEIELYNKAGSTHLAVDVLGWFATGADSLQPLSPRRVWETRSGSGFTTIDGKQQGTGRLGSNRSRSIPILGRAGVPTTDVGAVALNVTAIAPDAPSFLTIWPTGLARPTASNLNLAPGQTLPNMVIVPVSSSGSIDVFNRAGSTDVVIDVLGWFPGVAATQPASGRLFYSGVTEIMYTDLATRVEQSGPEVLTRDTEFAVNAKGTELVYAIDDYPDTQVAIADLATGAVKKTFTFQGTVEGWSLVYPSPDDQLYATIVTDENNVFGPSRLLIHDRNGTETESLDNTRAFQWGSDGSVVVITDPGGTGDYAMYVIPKTGPAHTVVTFDRPFDDLPSDIAVSADLTTIAYADGAAIYTVPFAGGATPRKIVDSAVDLGEPTFSPDGRLLALSRDGDSGFLLKCDGVYIVPVLTAGDPVHLVGGDDDPFKLITAGQSRVTSCGVGMRWR